MFYSRHWLENLGDLGFGPGVSITYDVVVSKCLEGLGFSWKVKGLNQWFQRSPPAVP